VVERLEEVALGAVVVVTPSFLSVVVSPKFPKPPPVVALESLEVVEESPKPIAFELPAFESHAVSFVFPPNPVEKRSVQGRGRRVPKEGAAGVEAASEDLGAPNPVMRMMRGE
jgi:hypothetical protein